MTRCTIIFVLGISFLLAGCSQSGPSADDDKRVREGMAREYTPEELAKMGAKPGAGTGPTGPASSGKTPIPESGK